jgi:Arc/MetJ-type ribon-helix-helix transcriptional regulator
MTTQVLIRLPTEVARRFRNAIPARQRSEFVRKLLEENLPNVDEHMYELALQAEAFDRANPQEVSELDATFMDGLDPNETFDNAKLLALCQK